MRYTSKRGKRGGKRSAVELKDIHSKLDGRPAGSHAGHAHNLRGTTITAQWSDAAGIYNEAAEVEERRDTHLIPRKSLTRKLLLNVFPQQIETAPIKGKQLDKARYYGTAKTSDQVAHKMIEVSDERVIWKSDRSLLRRGSMDSEIGTFKREGEIRQGLDRRRYREVEPEVKAVLEDCPVYVDPDVLPDE